jgi:hypothetical protein
VCRSYLLDGYQVLSFMLDLSGFELLCSTLIDEFIPKAVSEPFIVLVVAITGTAAQQTFVVSTLLFCSLPIRVLRIVELLLSRLIRLLGKMFVRPILSMRVREREE